MNWIDHTNDEDLVWDVYGRVVAVKAPGYLVRIAQTKSPAHEWRVLITHYPEIVGYLIRDEPIPRRIFDQAERSMR